MSNYDEKTGIAYGVISPNAISSEALGHIYDVGTDPHYENAKQELLNDIEAFCDERNMNFEHINTDSFIDAFTDSYPGNDDGQMDYSDNEYTLHVSGDNFGIFVIKSPYYTYCRKCSPCSPCAPGAGDLNNPLPIDDIEVLDNYDKAYCLDKSFFDDEYAKIPYRVFRFDNDQEVI
jgi:hypothetical protein